MFKLTVDVGTNQLEQMIDHLPMRDKIKLTRRLERATWGERLDELFKGIDQRRKKHPISDKEISQEIAIVRRQIYGPRSR